MIRFKLGESALYKLEVPGKRLREIEVVIVAFSEPGGTRARIKGKDLPKGLDRWVPISHLWGKPEIYVDTSTLQQMYDGAYTGPLRHRIRGVKHSYGLSGHFFEYIYD